jgi:hypothetical protein
LDSYPWVKQISLFYDDDVVARELVIEEGAKFRRALSRAYPNSVFLWRLMIKNLSGTWFPYWTAFTTGDFRTKDIDPYCKNLYGDARVRRVREGKIESFRNAVMTQRPHDLQALLPQEKIKRFSLVNGNAIQKFGVRGQGGDESTVEEISF